MKKSIFLGLSAALVLVLSSFLLPADGYKVGDKVMVFNLKNIDNKMVSLGHDASAKGYIVVFTCNTCPVAKAYEQRIVELNKTYAPKGYPVIAINANDAGISPGDSFEQMQQRAISKSYGFPYLLDATQEVAKTYGARSTPTIYVVKREGNDYVLAYHGAIDNNSNDAYAASTHYVAKAVDALLQNKPVEVTSTKAIGCGIKWKM
ncbi:thioredoxin family protein [Emticicia sp. TH156]|uniref:thioredoxin family protein n=1 Tax=Emticicia sp. TH156 TaxID=2067454 RepID=UPI000C786A16|nr:thioredoxin family protein [Emticicia sp. TH156]PLK46530.1 thioredoxin family protein [Emticicia sp. TH156]